MKPDAQQKQPVFRLPDTISSEQDLNGLIVEIHECVKWLSHETIKKKTGASQADPPPTVSPAAQQLMHDYGANETQLESIIKELENLQRKSQVITITLAAPPSGTIKKTLVGWCRENIAANVLVNFSFNRGILGGMVVRAGSRVFDWSFRRQIMSASDKFPEVLRNV